MSEQHPKKPPSVEQRLSYMAGHVLALNIAVGCLLKRASESGSRHCVHAERV